jgi:photosynthetic reaction center H subunit
MYDRIFAGTFDLTVLVLYAFFAFFGALVLYLLREGRREGFPLEHDVTGRLESVPDIMLSAEAKTFILPTGGSVQKPDGLRDVHVVNLRRTAAWSGSPFEPEGDPMTAGVGPGAYAMRADRPDVSSHGETRLAPLRIAGDYHIDARDPDLRGMTIFGVDGVAGGVVSDIWVDRAEFLVRYLEIAPTGAVPGHTVLIPMAMCTLNRKARNVSTDSVRGDQIAGAPTLANPTQVTLREEERIVAYYGAGYLYASPKRSEPVL